MEATNSHVPSVALFVTVSIDFNEIINQYFVFQRSEIDFSHRSPSPICQRWFMVLYLKSEAKELALTVTRNLFFPIKSNSSL
jgi:hypothetical protein